MHWLFTLRQIATTQLSENLISRFNFVAWHLQRMVREFVNAWADASTGVLFWTKQRALRPMMFYSWYFIALFFISPSVCISALVEEKLFVLWLLIVFLETTEIGFVYVGSVVFLNCWVEILCLTEEICWHRTYTLVISAQFRVSILSQFGRDGRFHLSVTTRLLETYKLWILILVLVNIIVIQNLREIAQIKG